MLAVRVLLQLLLVALVALFGLSTCGTSLSLGFDENRAQHFDQVQMAIILVAPLLCTVYVVWSMLRMAQTLGRRRSTDTHDARGET